MQPLNDSAASASDGNGRTHASRGRHPTHHMADRCGAAPRLSNRARLRGALAIG